MESFVQKHARSVIGVLSGFDRLVFRGTIRQLAHVSGLDSYLAIVGVLLKDFGKHAEAVSQKLKTAVTGAVEALGRPVLYLSSSAISKEQQARTIAERDGVQKGTICCFSCVEPCQSFEVYRNRQTRHIELQPRLRKCLFLYRYVIHPRLGFMHARIQTWFPFNVQVCLNGREWLARQMDQAGLDYLRRDNCFPWLQDFARAQQLMNAQLRTDWPALLDGIVQQLNPAHAGLFGAFRAPYYWSTYQSEWATDLAFRNDRALAKLYPRLIRHGMASFASPDVMRFLGRKVPEHGGVRATFQGEIVSDTKQRPEGVRIKHRVNGNSIKMYDKHGSVLRVETTINDPRDFKVFRPKQGEQQGRRSWQKMRQGIADLHRRTVVSHAANVRYLEALARIDDATPLGTLVACLCRPAYLQGRRVRAMQPWAPHDLALLQAIHRGEFALNGLRNRDLCRLLFETPASTVLERRRRAAAVGRQLQLLRAHRLLKKVPRTHRYQLTNLGRTAIAALLAAHAANTQKLTKIAA